MRIKRPSGLTLLTCALLVLLPALAVLQYRWLGQVSAADGDRMERSLATAALQFREEFDGEIGRALLTLIVGSETARQGASDYYSDRYDTWLNTAGHPQIIADVYIVDATPTPMGWGRGRREEPRGPAPQLRIRKWHPDTHRFEPAPWFAPLEKWRPDFDQDLADFIARREPNRPYPYRGEESLIVTQLRSSMGPAFGFTVIRLDLDYMRTKLLPELTRTHFSHDEGNAYRIAVVAADNPNDVLFQSNPREPVDLSNADATEPLFGRGFSRGRGGPSRDSRGGGGGPSAPQAGGLTAPGSDAAPRVRRDDGARWRLFVQHRSGSLEAAVTAARHRNLAVGFGVLLLLTISVGLLAVSSRRAQRLMRQQMEFVAGVSHELRTPVAVIRSAAENLSQGVIGNADRVKRYGSMIEGEAKRLGGMIEQVLQYSGIESGHMLSAQLPLAPGELVQSAINGSLPMLDEGLDVHRTIDADLPAVLGDEAALRSAVQNLIANAAKYGGADRWIGVRVQHARNGRRSEVKITVSDHGPGIPAQEVNQIFEPFYRGPDAIARQIHGNGLGLSLVRRIVMAHGGSISVATKPGAGSAFTITLPAVDAEVPVRAAADDLRPATQA